MTHDRMALKVGDTTITCAIGNGPPHNTACTTVGISAKTGGSDTLVDVTKGTTVVIDRVVVGFIVLVYGSITTGSKHEQ